MGKIDQKMEALYNQAYQQNNQIDKEHADAIIIRAHRLNHSGSSFSGAKGDRSLRRLVTKNKDCFTLEAQQAVNSFLRTGRRPQMVSGQSNVGYGNTSTPIYGHAVSNSTNNIPQPQDSDPQIITFDNHSDEDSTTSSHEGGAHRRRRRRHEHSNHAMPHTDASTSRPNGNVVTNGSSLSHSTETPEDSHGHSHISSAGSHHSSLSSHNSDENHVHASHEEIDTPLLDSDERPDFNNHVSSNSHITNVLTSEENHSAAEITGTNSTSPAEPGEDNVTTVENTFHHTRPTNTNNDGMTNVTPVTTPEGDSIAPVTETGEVDPTYGKVILDFQANKPLWHCHWFPMQERRADGHDNVNNLYAPGGALDKHDQVTGKNAQAYEKAHNRKIFGEPGVSWFGHCNNAAEVACLLPKVKRAVSYNGVKFRPIDIQGLLVKAVPNLVAPNVDFVGNRNNGRPSDAPSDPAPHIMIKTLQNWSASGEPFVMDIDNGAQVWNYPFDRVKIFESNTPPQGFDASGLSGNVRYYRIEASGTEFPDQSRIFNAYVEYDGRGNAISSNWIKTSDSHKNPDFLWRPHPIGDVMDKSTWVYRKRGNNPEIDMAVVYEIFMKSI